MAALGADRNTPQRSAQDLEFPVAASTNIYAGALVYSYLLGPALRSLIP